MYSGPGERGIQGTWSHGIDAGRDTEKLNASNPDLQEAALSRSLSSLIQTFSKYVLNNYLVPDVRVMLSDSQSIRHARDSSVFENQITSGSILALLTMNVNYFARLRF